MGAVLQFFKPFDLQPVYEAWTDAPIFDGQKPNAKKGRLDVDSWLDAIQEGCLSRKVPKNLWHEIAQHYMGRNAAARLYEVKKVMLHLHGGKFTWNWEKFRTAMHNLRWDVDTKEMMPIRWGRRVMSGILCKVGKKEDAVTSLPPSPIAKNASKVEPFLTRVPRISSSSKPALERSAGSQGSSLARKKQTSGSKDEFITDKRPALEQRKKSTLSRFLPESRRNSLDLKEKTQDVGSPSSVKERKLNRSSTAPPPKPSVKAAAQPPPFSDDADAVQRITQVPLWLLQTCLSLETLTSEYPKTMSMLAAVLITVGSIPSLPVVSAGAAGAFLASSAAHALGSVAMGVGSLIVAQTTQSSIATACESTGK